jgi:hypothetical protein
MAEARDERAREAYAAAEAERREGRSASPEGEAPPALPDLAQVTGWSRADASKAPYDDPQRPGFAAWRMGEEGKPSGGDAE